jgi:hypothetical protein
MKSKKITYFKYFSLFFAIAVLLFIAGCTGVTVSSTVTTTYNGNGSTAGTVPVDPASPYEYGATVTVLGNTGDLIRINGGGTSYYFIGWNTKADGSASDQAEGSTFTIGVSNVILYAQWTPYVLRDIGPAGGYIFYDKGYYSKADFTIVKAEGNGTVPITPTYDSWRYLEAAPSNQSTGAEWGCINTLIWGADGIAVGTGKQNTIDIEAGCTTSGTAADICANLSLGGYDDWFLPSKGELAWMWKNLKDYGVGGFPSSTAGYWSSSEKRASQAWFQNFYSGSISYNAKNQTYDVRAVRVF